MSKLGVTHRVIPDVQVKLGVYAPHFVSLEYLLHRYKDKL